MLINADSYSIYKLHIGETDGIFIPEAALAAPLIIEYGASTYPQAKFCGVRYMVVIKRIRPLVLLNLTIMDLKLLEDPILMEVSVSIG